MVLQTVFEWATACCSPVYAVFVDLAKVYDSVPRGRLFSALVCELDIPDSLVKALVLLYEGVT